MENFETFGKTAVDFTQKISGSRKFTENLHFHESEELSAIMPHFS